MRWICLVLLIIFLTSCQTREWRFPAGAEDRVDVYVSSNGWHTGIIIPNNQETKNQFSFLNNDFEQAGYYEFGWGDFDYYQTDGAGFWLGLKGACWPTKSVIHVMGFPQHPDDFYNRNQLMKVTISHKGFHLLLNELAHGFEQNKIVKPLRSGIYRDSRFYRGSHWFCLFRNCNRWTAMNLKRAGVPIRTMLAFRADNIFKQLKSANENAP
jgi:uncharacterized protein (TIGR02117 family)